MSTALHREATVGPDGNLTVSVPELQPGQRVTVTIEPDEPEQTAPQTPPDGPSMIDIIREAPGHLLFNTAEEVDDYLRQERESWDR